MHERVVALLWWHGLADSSTAVRVPQLCREIETAGYPGQNVSRIRGALKVDRRVAKAVDDSYKVVISSRTELDEKYTQFLRGRPVQRSDSVIDPDLFLKARTYIQKIVAQINASYDYGLYDCCAVMCRRLLETLIIEAYEHQGVADDLKGPDGNFKMLSGLVATIEGEKRFNIGRSAKSGLRNFKNLGDNSAHNRRFNARKTDIDGVQNDIRVAAEEFLHISGQAD